MSLNRFVSFVFCGLVLVLASPQEVLSAPHSTKPFWLSAQSVTLSSAQIIGKWTKAYDPSLKGVYEVDSGYLIILPDGTFKDYLHSDNSTPASMLTGNWRIRGNTVTLVNIRLYDEKSGAAGRKPDFSWSQRIFQYSPSRKVVLFDAIKVPIVADVLTLDGGLNYSFAKTR
jgi:hypothetical protein